MKRVNELPPWSEGRAEGRFTYALLVPADMLDSEGFIGAVVDMHMDLPQNLIYTVATGDYRGIVATQSMEMDKTRGVIEFEVRRKTVEEMENPS